MATLIFHPRTTNLICFVLCIFLVLLLTCIAKQTWISKEKIHTLNKRSLLELDESEKKMTLINSEDIFGVTDVLKNPMEGKESETSSTVSTVKILNTVNGLEASEPVLSPKHQQNLEEIEKLSENYEVGDNSLEEIKRLENITTASTPLSSHNLKPNNSNNLSDLKEDFCDQELICEAIFDASDDFFLIAERENMSMVIDKLFDENDYNCTCPNQQTSNKENEGTSYGQSSGRPSMSINSGVLAKDEHDEYIKIIKSIKWALNLIDLVMVTLAILAFTRTNARSSSTTFIIALNGFEFLAAFLSIVGFALKEGFGETTLEYLTYTKWASLYTTAVSRRIVYILNMLMSGQRLLVISLPFLARTTLRNRINVVIIIVVVVITFGAHVYIPLTYTTINRGGRVYSLIPSSLYKTYQDQFEMASIASKFLFAFFPLIIGLLASLIMLVYLKHLGKNSRALRAVQTSPKNNRKERQMTLMILVSSLTFTLLCLPANTHLLVTTYTEDYGYYKKDHYLFLVVHEALLGLLTLGDITNFLSYLFLSSAFRDQLFTALGPICFLFGHSKTTDSKATCSSSFRTSLSGKS